MQTSHVHHQEYVDQAMEARKGARHRHTGSRLGPAHSWGASCRRFYSIRRSISQYLSARGSGGPRPSSGLR